MSIQSLRGFQEEAVASGVGLFAQARALLDVADGSAADRASVVNHNGYLLIEAPTGSGKTLMAGTIVERFSHVEDVVWFWFAPFKGVVGQSAAFLREQFHGLRLRELTDDRVAAGSRRGDVFVTTWQTVATRIKDKRNVRKEGDANPSVDALIESLREQGPSHSFPCARAATRISARSFWGGSCASTGCCTVAPAPGRCPRR